MANYSKGKIAIPSVTGNIVINITAVQGVVPITNLVDVYGIAENSRIKSDGSIATLTGYCVVGNSNTTGLIPISNGDVVRVKGAQWQNTEDYYTCIAFYISTEDRYADSNTIYIDHTVSKVSCSYDTENDVMSVTLSNLGNRDHALLCVKGADPETLVITKNEEII